jgi:hypothetical protein
MSRGYSPKQLHEWFDCIGPDGCRLYAITQVTLDFAFPCIYGLLFVMFIMRLFEGRLACLLVLLPVLAVGLDLLENVTLAYLGLRNGGGEDRQAQVAAMFTIGKWIFVYLASLVVGVRIIRRTFCSEAGR